MHLTACRGSRYHIFMLCPQVPDFMTLCTKFDQIIISVCKFLAKLSQHKAPNIYTVKTVPIIDFDARLNPSTINRN